MADFTPAITAIRECCLGHVGATRAMAAGDLVEGAYEHTPEHEAARALRGPSFEVEITDTQRHAESPSEHSDVVLLGVTVQIRAIWLTESEIVEDSRATLRAEALSTLEKLRAALMRAGNLTETSDGDETGIVSGCLHRHLGHRLERADWRGRRLVYVSRFTTVLKASQTAG